MKAYIAFFAGDIAHLAPLSGQNLDQVLVRIRDEYGYGKSIPESEQDGYTYQDIVTPDPEDDKIEVWELDTDTGKCKIVWGFWGWYWGTEWSESGLDQGIIPGNNKSLYEIAMTE